MSRPHAVSLLALFAFISPALAGVEYEAEVRPILKSTCFKCHGGPRAKKDFRMDDLEKFKEHIGPDQYIVPGDPGASEVIRRVTMPEGDPDRMPPPTRGEPLDDQEIAILTQWIKEGASLEAGETTAGDESEPAMTPEAEGPDPAALHVWTGVKGQQIKAYFVKANDTHVLLRAENGQEKPFPLSAFADESRALIEALVKTTP